MKRRGERGWGWKSYLLGPRALSRKFRSDSERNINPPKDYSREVAQLAPPDSKKTLAALCVFQWGRGTADSSTEGAAGGSRTEEPPMGHSRRGGRAETRQLGGNQQNPTFPTDWAT